MRNAAIGVVLSGALLLLAGWVWLGLRQPEKTAPVAESPPVSGARYHLRLGLNLSRGSALHAAAERFAALIAERSHGEAQVTVHPDQELGYDEQMVEMARNGELDLLLTPTAKLSTVVPAMQYADLPFYFSSREELYAMLDGEPGNRLLDKLSSIGLVGITFWENGFKHFTAHHPLRRPEDFADHRFRVMKSRLLIEQFKALDAVAVPIDFHATRQALLDGAVSGQENPLVAIVGMRLHEVQKYLTLSSHAWLGYVFSASQSVFADLPESLRELIISTARELTMWEREETVRREAAFLEQIRQAGVEIIELTEEERRRFQERLAPLARMFSMTIGYDLLAKTEELRLRQALPQLQPAPLLIGLNVDLSGGAALAGASIFRGVELAVEQINASGGLLGRPVRLVAMDHSGNQVKALENLNRLVAFPDLVAVVGGLNATAILYQLEAVHQRHIPYLVPWAATSKVVENGYQPNYVFRLSLRDADVAPFLLQRALQVAAGRNVAVLLERSDWGRSNEAAMASVIAKAGANRVIVEWVNQGEQAFGPRLQGLQEQGVGVVMMATNFVESTHIVNAMAQLDPPLPILAHWGLTGGDFWAATEKALRRVDLRFVQSAVLPTGNPALTGLIERYRHYYGLDPEQPVLAVTGMVHSYELTQLLAQAIRQAGSSDRIAIHDALERIQRYSGVLRDYAPPFRPDQHDVIGGLPFQLARFNLRGQIVLAE